MQHHAGQRTARTSAPMRAAPLRPFQQTLRLQKRLRPAVAPPEIVALRQLLVKVLGGEAVGSARDTEPLLPAPDPPEPADPTPCPASGPTSRPLRRPRSGRASVETSAPRSRATPQLPTE